MIGFILGLFVGCGVGVTVMALCNAAAAGDRYRDDCHTNSAQKSGEKSADATSKK